MKRTKFDEAHDQRIANEVGVSMALMCTAHGCPNLWSTSIGYLCRWHADAPPERWPEVTQTNEWEVTERAIAFNAPQPSGRPLSLADKHAILAKLRATADRMRQTAQAQP